MNTVAGLFDHYNNVDWAIEVLENYGVDDDRISIVALDKGAIEPGPVAGLVGTTTTGVVSGGLVGILSSLSAFVVPGTGPVIVTGSLASALFTTLGTTAFDATAGGLLGALMDLGFSEEDSAFYAEGVKRGHILIYVETGSHEKDRIRAILRGAGGSERKTGGQIWQNEERNIFDEAERQEHSYLS